jgi:general nucleoside transport system permease protein
VKRELIDELYTLAAALLVAMAAGSLLILAVGESPARVYHILLAGTWGSWTGIGQVIAKATPLCFTGLAVALAFRAGLFNIGAEGQMQAGGFAAAVCAAALPADVSPLIALPLAIAAAAAAGALAGAIPGALRATTGAHEVITTIMLNIVIGGVLLWLGNEWAFVPGGQTHTPEIPEAARLGRLIEGSAANGSALLALAAAVNVWWFLTLTRRGFEWRAAGLSPGAAEAGGVRLGRVTIAAMAASGALAGLAATHFVLGYKYYFQEDVGRGIGFMGIAVALLGRNHPLGVAAAAVLFGTLSQGGVAISEQLPSGDVPRELVDVLQAVILLALVAAAAAVRRRPEVRA